MGAMPKCVYVFHVIKIIIPSACLAPQTPTLKSNDGNPGGAQLVPQGKISNLLPIA